ncbi:coth-domain-containing protein [Backusella circina FSU 941]|nr:coth-domain-containing protein [Backusella circina FSU 941]
MWFNNLRNITYNVVASLPESNMSLFVIVDNVSFPLQSSSGILFKGEAPAAKYGYQYALFKNDEISVSEPFLRDPISENTVNEFFNRSRNTYDISPLPQVFPSIPIINKIKSDLHKDGQISTIHLWGEQAEVDNLHNNQLDDIKVKLNMDYIGLENVQSFENVKISVSGRSTRHTPKLSYTLNFDDKNGSSLYGFKNFKLRSLAFEPSYLREGLYISCSNAAGVPTNGFSYVRVFINNKPIGLYGLIDSYHDPWVAGEFANGDEGYLSGDMYEGTFAELTQKEFIISDLKYWGENLTKYELGQYKYIPGKKGHTQENFTALKDFTRFVDQTTENTPLEEWEKYFEVNGFMRNMALEDLLGNSDCFMAIGNNYFLYADPERSGRMIYLPYDFDTSIGISMFNMKLMLSGNYSDHPGLYFRPLTRNLFSNPDIAEKYQNTIFKLASELTHPSIMIPRIDSVANMIRQDVEWDKSLERVGIVPEISLEDIINTNDLDYDYIKKTFYPPEYETDHDHLDLSATFDQAINGPIDAINVESVKGFIIKKNNAVLEFYKH